MKTKSLKRRVAEFMLEHYWPATNFTCKNLMRWIQWAIAQQRIFVCMSGGNITGMTVVRPVSLRRMQNTRGYELETDPEGPVLYVDVLISTNKQVWKTLLWPVICRYGYPLIAWRELKYQERLRVYKMETFRRAIYGRRGW